MRPVPVVSAGVIVLTLSGLSGTDSPQLLTETQQALVTGGTTYAEPGVCVPDLPGGECNNPYQECDPGDTYCSEGHGTGFCYYETEFLNPSRCTSDPNTPPGPFLCTERPENGQIICSRQRICKCFDHPQVGWICSDWNDPASNPWIDQMIDKCELQPSSGS